VPQTEKSTACHTAKTIQQVRTKGPRPEHNNEGGWNGRSGRGQFRRIAEILVDGLCANPSLTF
jgi:hypothetical protein